MMEFSEKPVNEIKNNRGNAPKSAAFHLANFIRKVSGMDELSKIRPPTYKEFPKKNGESTEEYYQRKNEFMEMRTKERAEKDKQTIQQGIKELTAEPKKVYPFLSNLYDHINKKVSKSTGILYYYEIKKTLRRNKVKIDIDEEKLYVKFEKRDSYKKIPITKNDIKILLDNVDEKHKALYLLLASSGLRIFEAISLTRGRIELNSNPCKIIIKPYYTKTRQERETYCSQEAVDILKRFAGKKHSNEYIFVNSLEEKIVKNSEGKEELDPKVRKNLEQAEHAQEVFFIRLRKKCKLGEKRLGSHNSLTLHKFRRFTYTQGTKVNADFAAYLCGWNESMKSVYYSPEDADDLYKKIEPYVSIYSVISETQEELQEQVRFLSTDLEKALELEKKANQQNFMANKLAGKILVQMLMTGTIPNIPKEDLEYLKNNLLL